jgi:hypothetical protein
MGNLLSRGDDCFHVDAGESQVLADECARDRGLAPQPGRFDSTEAVAPVKVEIADGF